MSKFMDFNSHIMGNEEATKKVTDLMAKFDAETDRDIVIDELIVFAKEEGYDFKKDEVKGFLEGATVAGELSDDELEAVAGGKITGGCFILGIDYDDNGNVYGMCLVYGNSDDGACFGVGAV